MDNDLTFSDWITKLKRDDLADKNGWVKLLAPYTSYDKMNLGKTYSGLVDEDNINEVLKDTAWHINPFGPFYKPFITISNGKKDIQCKTPRDFMIEPIVYCRDYLTVHPTSTHLVEELINWFNLYESNKKNGNKEFLFTDNDGEIEEAVQINDDEVKIKSKFLYEYMYFRKKSYVFLFDLGRYSPKTLVELKLNEKHSTIPSQDSNIHFDLIYNPVVDGSKTASYIRGKKIYKLPRGYKSWYFDADEKNKKYESFIIGITKNGTNKEMSCKPRKNDGSMNLKIELQRVYFKREVLQKYNKDTDKYIIEDGQLRCKGGWNIRIDNNHPDHISTLLLYLGYLPILEQKHWKTWNIQPQHEISRTEYQRSIHGRFANPTAPDLVFISRFSEFNNKWFMKFDWHLFRPLNPLDKDYLVKLHIPYSDNLTEFREQVIGLDHCIIESLNKEEMEKFVEPVEGSINVLEKYLTEMVFQCPDMINFLRKLQTLKSKIVSHRSSSLPDKQLIEAYKYFKWDENNNYIEVFTEIMIKSCNMISALSSMFLIEKTINT